MSNYNVSAFSDLEQNLAINKMVEGELPFEKLTLKGLPQTAGAPAGYGDLASAVGASLSIGSAAGQLFSKMKNSQGDTCVFVTSDSTGNETFEFVYRWAEWIASQYPAYTVEYYLWGTTDYAAAATIQTGTTANVLKVYNAAISGSKPDFIMGDKFANAVKNIPQADLVVMNHGHNCITSYTDANPSNKRSNELLEALYSILQVHSGAGVIMTTQNPRRDDDNYAPMYRAIVRAAALCGASLADTYADFIAAGKPSSWYNDNIHPSAIGQDVYLNKMIQLSIPVAHKSGFSALDITAGFNYAVNGNFAAFSAAVPDGWAASNVTTTKELAILGGLNAYSVKIVSTASAGALQQNLLSEYLRAIKGRWLTFAVRMYIPTGQASTAGRILLHTSSQTFNTTAPSGAARDGWMWKVISVFVKDSDTYVRVGIFGDSAGGNGFCLVDRAILVSGENPMDCL